MNVSNRQTNLSLFVRTLPGHHESNPSIIVTNDIPADHAKLDHVAIFHAVVKYSTCFRPREFSPVISGEIA
jgi:hypothetical protein